MVFKILTLPKKNVILKVGPEVGPEKERFMADWILGPSDGAQFPAMPTNQIHMAAGGSGAGKTTVLFQMIKAMKEGKDFFGYPTRDWPAVYVPYDRDTDETEYTMARVGITPEQLPILPMEIVYPPANLPDNRFMLDMQKVRNAFPRAKLLIVDGFYTLVPYGLINDYLRVAAFMQMARRFCRDNDITIIGVAHSPKQRQGNMVMDPRQMIQGSVAGGGFSSCGVVIIREKEDSECANRYLYILPRNCPDKKLAIGMGADGLDAKYWQVEQPKGRRRSEAHENFVELLKSYGQEMFTMSQVAKDAGGLGISRGSINQWLGEMVAFGDVERVKHGLYRLAGGADAAEEVGNA